MAAMGLKNSDAGRAKDLLSLDRKRLAQVFLDPVSDPGYLFHVVAALDEDDKFISAEPGDHIGRPHRFSQTIGDGDQQLIAHEMAKAVVDVLEPVEVDE